MQTVRSEGCIHAFSASQEVCGLSARESEKGLMKELQEEVAKDGSVSLNGTLHSEIVTQLILAMREDNKFQAVKQSERLIEAGLVNVLHDEAEEWRFHLIGELAIIMLIFKEKDRKSVV